MDIAGRGKIAGSPSAWPSCLRAEHICFNSKKRVARGQYALDPMVDMKAGFGIEVGHSAALVSLAGRGRAFFTSGLFCGLLGIFACVGSVVSSSMAVEALANRMEKVVYPLDLQDALSRQNRERTREVIVAGEKRDFRQASGALVDAGVAGLPGSKVLLAQLALENDVARRSFDFKGLLQSPDANLYISDELRYLMERQAYGQSLSEGAKAFEGKRATRHARASMASTVLAILSGVLCLVSLSLVLLGKTMLGRVRRVQGMVAGAEKAAAAMPDHRSSTALSSDEKRRIALGPNAFLERNHDNP